MSCTLKHCSQATGFEKKTGLGSAEAVASSLMRATLRTASESEEMRKTKKGAQVRVSLPKALAKASFIYCLPKSQFLFLVFIREIYDPTRFLCRKQA